MTGGVGGAMGGIGGGLKGNLYDASGRSLLPKGLPPGLTMQQLQTAVAQGLLPNPGVGVTGGIGTAASGGTSMGGVGGGGVAGGINRGRGRPVGSYKSPLMGGVPGGAASRTMGQGKPEGGGGWGGC